MRKSKIYLYTDEEFINILKQSYSMSDCLTKFGFSKYGSGPRETIKKRCLELSIDLQTIFCDTPKKIVSHKFEINDILVQNSQYKNRVHLKNRLISEGLLQYQCALCGNNGYWNGKKLVLQLDHINGINDDNRIDNLRLLCPNCHSQTQTFSGRNLKLIYGQQQNPVNKESKQNQYFCSNCGKELFGKCSSGLCSNCIKIINRVVDSYKNVINLTKKW